MSPTNAPTLRSLYRRFLRELPSRQRPQTILSHPSPLQKRIRSSVSALSTEAASITPRLQATEQFLQYLAAQRMYATLVERYNPGMNMNEEERVRLTARRVGMDLPVDVESGGSGGGGKK